MKTFRSKSSMPRSWGISIKSLLLLLFTNGLFAGEAFALIPCHSWQERVDQTMTMSGPVPRASELSSEEKMHAIACLFALEGKKTPSRVAGQTASDVSQLVPQASVEVGALFFIRYLYYGDWQHCDTVALSDRKGRFNTRSSVRKAYASYKQWFALVQQIGLEKSMELGLDPMDGCVVDRIRWNGRYQWEYLVDRHRRKTKEHGQSDGQTRTTGSLPREP